MNRLPNTNLLSTDDDVLTWDIIDAEISDLLDHESVYQADGQEFAKKCSEDDIEILTDSEVATDDSFGDFQSEQTFDTKDGRCCLEFPSFCETLPDGEGRRRPSGCNLTCDNESSPAVSPSASSSSIETLDITRALRVQSLYNTRNILEDGKRSLFELYDIRFEESASRPAVRPSIPSDRSRQRSCSTQNSRRNCSTQNALQNDVGGHASFATRPLRRGDHGQRMFSSDGTKSPIADAHSSFHTVPCFIHSAVAECSQYLHRVWNQLSRAGSHATLSNIGPIASRGERPRASVVDDWKPSPAVLGAVVILGLTVVFAFGVHVGSSFNSMTRVRVHDTASITQSDEFISCSRQKDILEDQLRSADKKGDKEAVVSAIWRQKFEEVIFENAELELKLAAIESQMTQSLKLARDNIAALGAEVDLFRDEVNDLKLSIRMKKRDTAEQFGSARGKARAYYRRRFTWTF